MILLLMGYYLWPSSCSFRKEKKKRLKLSLRSFPVLASHLWGSYWKLYARYIISFSSRKGENNYVFFEMWVLVFGLTVKEIWKNISFDDDWFSVCHHLRCAATLIWINFNMNGDEAALLIVQTGHDINTTQLTRCKIILYTYWVHIIYLDQYII